MGGAENAELLKYFSQRKVCLVEPHERPVRISTYASALNVGGYKNPSASKGLTDKVPLAPAEGLPNRQKVGTRER